MEQFKEQFWYTCDPSDRRDFPHPATPGVLAGRVLYFKSMFKVNDARFTPTTHEETLSAVMGDNSPAKKVKASKGRSRSIKEASGGSVETE